MKQFDRYHPDMRALHQGFQTNPCFVCQIVKQLPTPTAHIVFEDETFIAFLDEYPRQYGYTLVSPKVHLEQATAELDLGQYLALQTLIHHTSEAVRAEVDAERMYIFTFGSNQGNAHVHWHVVPLPKGTPYEQQQGAAVSWKAGVLKVPDAEMEQLAARLRERVEKRVNGAA